MSGLRRAASRRSLFCVALIAVVSCSPDAAQRPAAEAVSQFHSLYNAEDYSAIYAAADNAFRSASPEKEYVTFMAAVHRKLGLHKSSVSAGWGVFSGTQGTQVRLTFTTEFAEGTATEQFLYRVSSGKPYLLGYNINSPLLIIR